MAHVPSHSFVHANLALARASVQSAVQFVVVFGTEKQRARGSPRQREGEGEGEGGGQSFSIFRRALSGLVVRSTNIGNGAVYCVGDKEGEGGSAFAK